MKTSELIEQIISQRDDFDRSRRKYILDHPTFKNENDARITIFSKYIVLLDIALLHLMFRTFQLPSDSWWKNLPNEFRRLGIRPDLISTPVIQDRIEIMKVIDIFWALSHFLLLFSVLESSAKIIVSIAYPREFRAGRGDLTQIYQKLLGKNFADYKCLIELFELTRNISVHRGSIYFGPEYHVKYKEVIYDFLNGKIVNYGDFAKLLFVDIVPDILNIISCIVNSLEVSKHSIITDPPIT